MTRYRTFYPAIGKIDLGEITSEFRQGREGEGTTWAREAPVPRWLLGQAGRSTMLEKVNQNTKVKLKATRRSTRKFVAAVKYREMQPMMMKHQASHLIVNGTLSAIRSCTLNLPEMKAETEGFS